jgi:chromosome segregation ATPase
MSEELDGLFETLENDLLSKYEYNLLLNYITNLQKENEDLLYEINGYLKEKEKLKEKINKLEDYKQRNEKAIEYIKKDTRWFDSEYAKTYGMLCDCEGAKGDRLEVLVNPSNLLNILKGGDEE